MLELDISCYLVLFCFVTKVTLTEVLPCSISSREHRQGSLWHNPYSGSATEVAGITML